MVTDLANTPMKIDTMENGKRTNGMASVLLLAQMATAMMETGRKTIAKALAHSKAEMETYIRVNGRVTNANVGASASRWNKGLNMKVSGITTRFKDGERCLLAEENGIKGNFPMGYTMDTAFFSLRTAQLCMMVNGEMGIRMDVAHSPQTIGRTNI